VKKKKKSKQKKVVKNVLRTQQKKL